jgi:hypothetical protein
MKNVHPKIFRILYIQPANIARRLKVSFAAMCQLKGQRFTNPKK